MPVRSLVAGRGCMGWGREGLWLELMGRGGEGFGFEIYGKENGEEGGRGWVGLIRGVAAPHCPIHYHGTSPCSHIFYATLQPPAHHFQPHGYNLTFNTHAHILSRQPCHHNFTLQLHRHNPIPPHTYGANPITTAVQPQTTPIFPRP